MSEKTFRKWVQKMVDTYGVHSYLWKTGNSGLNALNAATRFCMMTGQMIGI